MRRTRREDLALQMEQMRLQREQNRSLRIQNFIDGPGFPHQEFPDPFQQSNVEPKGGDLLEFKGIDSSQLGEGDLITDISEGILEANIPSDFFTQSYFFNIQDGEAAVINQFGFDWYSNVRHRFEVDGEVIEDSITHQLAPTNDPKDVNIIADDYILFETFNGAAAATRTIGVLIDGFVIPQEIYEDIKRMNLEAHIEFDEQRESGLPEGVREARD